MPLWGILFVENVPLVEFTYPAFTHVPGGVTIVDSGLCCCVPCLMNAINYLCCVSSCNTGLAHKLKSKEKRKSSLSEATQPPFWVPKKPARNRALITGCLCSPCQLGVRSAKCSARLGSARLNSVLTRRNARSCSAQLGVHSAECSARLG